MDNYEAQIANLNRQIQKLKRENQAALSKQQRQYEASLRQIEEKMRRINENDRRKLENEYNKKLREYERFMRGELTSLDKEMQKEIRQNNREIQTLNKKIKDIEKQLKTEVKQLKTNLQQDLKRKKEIAKQYIQEFKEVLSGFDQLPHLKFTPKELEAIENEQKEFKVLEEGQMYEAQSAVAISLTSSLHRLEIKVDDYTNEWIKEYNVYKQYSEHLFHTIRHQMSIWQVDFAKSVKDKEVKDFYQWDFEEEKDVIKEIDYWAFGEYRCIVECLEENMEIIDGIETQGIHDYLLDRESLATSELVEKTNELQQRLNDIYSIYDKAVDNQDKYKERRQMMKLLLEEFEIRRGVTSDDIRIEKAKDDSTRDYVDYKVLAKNLRGDLRRGMHGILWCDGDVSIHIYIRPENLGDHYRNIVILYDDFGEHSGYIRSMEYDDYKMMIRILREQGLNIADNGYESEDNWYIPFINDEHFSTISMLNESNDNNIKIFANQLKHFINSR
ncbi:MAG: hypothetical protein LUH02_09640 [Erysipelotrichaceae bacterium]|nr:hypothetical protein [Erysipelotrichaceae bacterium]